MKHTSMFSLGLALVTLALTLNVFAEPRYSGDPGNTEKDIKPIRIRFASRLSAIGGKRIKLERTYGAAAALGKHCGAHSV